MDCFFTTDVFAEQNESGRRTMEDFYTVTKVGECMWLVGVFDGHGGDVCAKYFSENLPSVIEKELKDIKYYENNDEIEKMLKRVFIEEDEKFCDRQDSGTTFSGVLISKEKIFTVNLGDSRTIIIDKEKFYSTEDHKPNLPRERERILRDGGYVSLGGRVDGIINLSRALGDKNFKGNGINSRVSPEPDVEMYPFSKCKILIASDGFFDKVENKEAVDLVRNGENSEFLVRLALNKYTRDNITVIIIDCS